MKPMGVVIIGAGGHARETRWCLRALNERRYDYEFLGYVVTNLSQLTDRDSRSEVLGDYSWLEENSDSVDGLVLGIGTPAPRLRVARELSIRFPTLLWPALVHPTAQLDKSTCSAARGITIGAGVIGTVNLVLEDFSMLNFGSTIGHEAHVGAGAVVNPGANISGGVTIGEGALIGAGAVIRQYVRVGPRATVGAGAVVIRDVPEDSTVAGVPAVPLRSGPGRINAR